MELRQAVSAICFLRLLFVTMAQSSQSPCGTGYIAACLSTAIVAACGDMTATACICASSGQGAIATLVGPCLLSECPVTEILAIGNFATSACDQWLSTHLLTATAGGLRNTSSTAFVLASTTSTAVTTSNPADMSITKSPTTPTSSPTSLSTGTASQSLPVGADVGIGVGAFALVCVIVILSVLRLRRRRRRKEVYPEAHELQTSVNMSELADKPDGQGGVHVVEIPRQELEGFQFPFQVAPVEADSQSVRAQSRGRVAGTETTAFDFESQKVLLTPGLREYSRASSRAPGSAAASVRRQYPDT